MGGSCVSNVNLQLPSNNLGFSFKAKLIIPRKHSMFNKTFVFLFGGSFSQNNFIGGWEDTLRESRLYIIQMKGENALA